MTKHLISAQDLSKEAYDEIIRRTEKFIKEGIPYGIMNGKVVATLFFMPSTRTMTCFQSAMIRSGGGWVGVMGEQGISMEKGESLSDTIREYSNFADIIILRHVDDDSAEVAAKVSKVPVINGGCGSREHGLVAAMMLPKMHHYLKKLEGTKIGIYGTPEINRVCKAFLPIMGYYNMEVYVDDLGYFPFPKEIEDRAKANGLAKLEYDKLDNFIGKVDYLMATRGLQKGIIPEDKFPKDKQELILKSYKPINTEHMKHLRQDAFLEMIRPLIFEIERDVDSDPRALYNKSDFFVESALAIMTYYLDIKID